MFVRGRIGPLPGYLRDLDLSEERAAIEERWIKPGKMLAWNLLDGSEFRILGPPFQGAGVEQDLRLGFCAFPTLELFLEWLDRAPEHVAIHNKLLEARKASGRAAIPDYSFIATGDRNADVADMRSKLRGAYQRLDGQDWGMPSGFSAERAFLGDEE